MIENYRNKIIIYNPGGLVKWLKPEEFGKISKTRNPIIASLLSRTIYVEKMGTGIKRIKSVLSKIGFPEPIFNYYEHSFYIELYDKKNLNIKSDVKSDANIKSDVNHNIFSQRQKLILEEIKIKGKIKSNDIVKQFGVNKDTAVKDLNRLMLEKKIIKKGVGRGTFYLLKRKDM